MAKPSKGKKSLKADQRAARREKTAPAVQDTEAQKEPQAQKAQVVQAEKPKNAVPAEEPASAGVPGVPPAQSLSLVDRAANFLKASVSWYTVVIVLLMAFMFYLRTVPSHDLVFTNWPWINGGTYVNVAEDDGVYHMRLLDNTLQHFPFRILYDPFTHFPYGNTIHFGPLFELIPAAFLLVIGLGHPNQMLVDTVAAYFPSFLGMLIIIPAYYIGKKLFGKPAGLLGAIAVAFMPGAFFWRSILGSTDHHVAEVLFMVCTVACLVYALDAARASDLSLERLKGSGWKALKMPLIYGALAGIFFGCYMLTWIGALLLGLIVFLYFTIQAFMDYYRGRSFDYVLILSALFFIIPAIMVLPYTLSNLTFQQVYYSLLQPVVLAGAFVGMAAEYGLSKVLRENKADKWAFPAAVMGIGVIGALAVFLVNKDLFNILQGGLTTLIPQGGLLTVEEAYPTFLDRAGNITFATVWGMFYWTFPAAILGLIVLAVRIFRTRRPGEIMFFIWNLIMVWALIVQNRYTYYFAVNAALLTAYLAAETFRLIDLDGLRASFAKKVDSFENFQRFVKKNTGSCLVAAFVVLAFLLISVYPALPLSDPAGSEGVLFQVAQAGTATMPSEWFDALSWMRTHTPDPQGTTVNASFDYWGGQYYKPSSQKYFDYPSSAYGVMSWWDYGHDIEYVAQRIPDANPFQAGIIEENGTTGASPFFCSTDENQSVQMLDKVGGRYVVIDNQMATGKFSAIQQWIGDTSGWETVTKQNLTYADFSSNLVYDSNKPVYTIVDDYKWPNSTMNRLYYNDANGMSHYRLVYESSGSYAFNFRYMQYNDQGQFMGGGLAPSPMRYDNYTDVSERYRILSKYVVPQNDQDTLYVYGARPPVKWVKVFEKVNGATLTGSAPDGSDVTARLTLKTDWGRTFNYTATTTAHGGTYSFVVPYPTEQMKGAGYSYGIMPQTKYTITYGNTTKSADVSESAVVNGAVVLVS